ncbi:g2371 [Coccomyxa viridis]|uniref:G2371 protein n=1 Tax=Coccomyxa viridis TaxID=1274662 RepID=A0ABP1FNZ3_9CHLO
MGAMDVAASPGNPALRADAEEFWPSPESRGSFPSQLFRHASDHMPRAQEGRYMSRQVRGDRLPQVQIESQKTLNRLDAVPFTPGNGVLTPTQSNMAMLWYQAQPGTPMTPYQPSPVQYQAVPVSPGWQMMVPAQSAGYWSPMQSHPNAGMQYWAGAWHPPNAPPHPVYPPEHAGHGPQHWQPEPPPQMPHMPQMPGTPTRMPQPRQPAYNGPLPRTPKHSSPGSSPMGHQSINGGPHSGLGAPRRPFDASASNDSRFAAVVRQNHSVLAEAAAKDSGADDSKLQSMVAELESLMALQGVHVALPSKASGEATLLHVSVQGNGQNAGNGHITGPKMKAAAAPHILPMSDDKRDAPQGPASEDKRGGSVRSDRPPLLNARHRIIDEAARSGVQLSAKLEELPQLNSSPSPG